MPSIVISPAAVADQENAAVADQENVPPSEDASIESIVANVRSAAVEAMGAQIDGSAKNSSKRSSGSRCDDPKKIESLYCKIDDADLLFSLADDVRRYLESISSAGNANSLSIGPAVKVLNYIVSAGKKQLKGM